MLQYRDLRLRKESLRPVCAERRYTGSEQTRGARQRTIAEPHEIDSSVHQAGFERPLQRVERHHGSGASGMKTLAASKQRSASQFVHQSGAQTTCTRVRLQLTDSSYNSQNFEPHSFTVYRIRVPASSAVQN